MLKIHYTQKKRKQSEKKYCAVYGAVFFFRDALSGSRLWNNDRNEVNSVVYGAGHECREAVTRQTE